MDDATRKYFQRIEWGDGNGQCPQCEGAKPNTGWWTDTVGHKWPCLLAQAMEHYGMTVEWERINPERSVNYRG